MIQNSFTSSSQFSTSLSYCPKRHQSKALVHGLSEKERIALIEKLKVHRNDIGLPMLLLWLLLIFRLESAIRKVRDCHLEIVEVEHKTGIRTKWHVNEPCCSGGNEQPGPLFMRHEAIDFDQITADLTSLSAKLAYVEYLCEVHFPMLDHFDAIHSRVVDGIKDWSMKARMQQVEMSLKVNLSLFRSSLQGTLVRAKYLSKRAQGQMQTVGECCNRNLSSFILSMLLTMPRYIA